MIIIKITTCFFVFCNFLRNGSFAFVVVVVVVVVVIVVVGGVVVFLQLRREGNNWLLL